MKKLLLAASLLVSVLAISQPKQKSSTKYKLTDLVNRAYDYKQDSLKNEFMCTEIIKKLNAIRKTKGMKPLIVDARLAPAAYHHAIYLDYVHDHKILSEDGKFTMTHVERYDIPNFTEILEPWDRIKLLELGVFKEIREELTVIGCTIKATYDQVTSSTLHNYEACDAHWAALTTNIKQDAIFMFITRRGTVITILGDYF
jgi:hypothetical protein